MNGLSKILLVGLPPALEKALLEQLSGAPDLEVRVGAPDAACDLLVAAQGAPLPPAAPGIPVLPVSLSRPLRLGLLLREMRRMIEEPALYLGEFALGPYRFQPQERLLLTADEKEIALTDKETDILVYLAKHAGRAVGRDELLRHVWRYNEGIDTHTLETHIYRLRQKLETVEGPGLLVTEEGGYRLGI